MLVVYAVANKALLGCHLEAYTETSVKVHTSVVGFHRLQNKEKNNIVQVIVMAID